MDPVTQGTLGAALAQAGADKRRIRSFAVAGGISGLAPDLDIFISSATDPLLYLEFHRQFSHSLIFIPVGATICALLLHGFLKKRLTWRETWLACLLGYASHGLLDACTSFGTQLFWPFSDMRVAWNFVSVVDPLFSVPLAALVGVAFLRRSRLYAFLGLGWVAVYLLIGLVTSRDKACDVLTEFDRQVAKRRKALIEEFEIDQSQESTPATGCDP